MNQYYLVPKQDVDDFHDMLEIMRSSMREVFRADRAAVDIRPDLEAMCARLGDILLRAEAQDELDALF